MFRRLSVLEEMYRLGGEHAVAKQAAWSRQFFDNDECWRSYLNGYRAATPPVTGTLDPESFCVKGSDFMGSGRLRVQNLD